MYFRHNGQHRISFNATEMRTSNVLQVRGIEFSTFFGGGESNYATPITTHAWFANFSLYDNCFDILATPVCDYGCNQRGECIDINKCKCDNGYNGDLCSCLNCNKYNIVIDTVIKECWVSGWIMDLNVINMNTDKSIKSIDFDLDFASNVSLTAEGGQLSFKQTNFTTYSTTLTKSIKPGTNYQFTAYKSYPEMPPIVIVNNVELE